jgi:CHAD domain-containing protein
MKEFRKSNPAGDLVESIDSALEAMTQSEAISDDDAHRSRKALKNARAALRLLRPSIGEAAYRREDAVLRNASRAISPLRDAKAQIDIVDSLKERHLKIAVSEMMPFQNKLRDKLTQLRRTVHRRAPNVRRSLQRLKASRQTLKALNKKQIRTDGVNRGLRKIYRQAREAFTVAHDRTTTASLHDWRKKTKYFANAVNVLGDAAQASQVSLAKKATRLGDWLGEEHDLAVLIDRIRREPTLGSAAKNRFQVAIKARRDKLQRKALHLGTALYAARAKRVAER